MWSLQRHRWGGGGKLNARKFWLKHSQNGAAVNRRRNELPLVLGAGLLGCQSTTGGEKGGWRERLRTGVRVARTDGRRRGLCVSQGRVKTQAGSASTGREHQNRGDDMVDSSCDAAQAAHESRLSLTKHTRPFSTQQWGQLRGVSWIFVMHRLRQH